MKRMKKNSKRFRWLNWEWRRPVKYIVEETEIGLRKFWIPMQVWVQSSE